MSRKYRVSTRHYEIRQSDATKTPLIAHKEPTMPTRTLPFVIQQAIQTPPTSLPSPPEWAFVTPAVAQAWLDLNTTNRKVRTSNFSKLVRDMLGDNWHPTHQGVAFFDDGAIADGQHRLIAITKAQIPQWILVSYGWPRSAANGIDQQARRTVADAATISGKAPWVDDRVVSLVRSATVSGRSLSVDEIVDTAIAHEPAVRFAREIARPFSGTRGLCSSGVSSVLAMAAHHGVPIPTLQRFAEILSTGEILNPNENAAIRARDFCRDAKVSGHGGILNLQKRVASALAAFVAERPLKILRAPNDVAYPFFNAPRQ
jgi:hypothetical protein